MQYDTIRVYYIFVGTNNINNKYLNITLVVNELYHDLILLNTLLKLYILDIRDISYMLSKLFHRVRWLHVKLMSFE